MTVNFVQINLNKSKKALDNFYSFLVRNPNTVGILNEPYTYKGITPKHRDFNIFGPHPAGRAAIIAPKHLPILAVSHLSSADYTVVLLETENRSQFIFLHLHIIIGLITCKQMHFMQNLAFMQSSSEIKAQEKWYNE